MDTLREDEGLLSLFHFFFSPGNVADNAVFVLGVQT